MSTLELKGGMYDMIAKVNDEALLLQLYQIIAEVVTENLDKTDLWDELDDFEKKELELAIEESHQTENLIDHHVVVEKYQQWLSK